MKSNKQRRAELRTKKVAKRAAANDESLAIPPRGLAINRDALAPDGSYDAPDFVKRGYYIDIPFICQMCGESQIWKAAQQKWWYEIAKGNIWTKARLCHPCRQKERARREEARRTEDR